MAKAILSNGSTGSIEIGLEYERRGGDKTPDAPALLFIMGLGAQMVAWDDEFLDGFVQRGYQTVRFDNRDIGCSTHLPTPSPDALKLAVMTAMSGGADSIAASESPYTLDDMADDAAALMDVLGIKQVHVVGASMGGMIAQLLAIRHPQRVRSLTSIMSTNAEPGLPLPSPQALGALLSPLGTEPAAIVEGLVRVFHIIGSPPPLFDEQRVRARVQRAYDRSFHPPGMVRQFLAVLRAKSRKEALAAVTVPTLVVHGESDPLVPVECGRATARAISGATMLSLAGMGHDLPAALWPTITAAISEVVERGEQAAR